MKPFTIYQFHNEGEAQKKNLLVGFVKAENAGEAKAAFLNANYPDDQKKKEVIRGLLAAWECKAENFERPDLLETIKQNRELLGTSA